MTCPGRVTLAGARADLSSSIESPTAADARALSRIETIVRSADCARDGGSMPVLQFICARPSCNLIVVTVVVADIRDTMQMRERTNLNEDHGGRSKTLMRVHRQACRWRSRFTIGRGNEPWRLAAGAAMMTRSGPALTVGAAFVAAALTVTVTLSLLLNNTCPTRSDWQHVRFQARAEAGVRDRCCGSGKDHGARSTDAGPPQGHGAGR